MKPTKEMIEAAAECIASKCGPPNRPAPKLSDLHDVEQELIREEAEAALQAALAAMWQDIRTAPKDGTSIIVRLGNSEVFAACYIDENWTAGSDIGWVAPTHWMPLPTLPEAP